MSVKSSSSLEFELLKSKSAGSSESLLASLPMLSSNFFDLVPVFFFALPLLVFYASFNYTSGEADDCFFPPLFCFQKPFLPAGAFPGTDLFFWGLRESILSIPVGFLPFPTPVFFLDICDPLPESLESALDWARLWSSEGNHYYFSAPACLE